MRFKSLIPLIAGLCIGGFALKIGLDTLQRAKGSQNTATTQIWAAKLAVPRGTMITAEMVKPVNFPTDLLPAGALQDKEQLVGRVPHIDAPAGLPILDEMLLPAGQMTGVHVPPGYRAVAVKIDEGSGVDFHLEPGCHVDVVGYFVTQSRDNKRETVARTLIENVQVAAVGARLSAVEDDGGRSSRPTRAVTLLVKPDKVPILHLAEQRGKIKLSMRNEEDAEEIGESRPISDEELLDPVAAAEDEQEQQDHPARSDSGSGLVGLFQGMFAKPAAAPPALAMAPAGVVTPAAPEPPPIPPWVVVVYRGDKQEVVRFVDKDSRQRVGADSADRDRSASALSAQSPAGRADGSSSRHESQNDSAAAALAGAVKDSQEQQEEEKDPETQEPSE